jgi:hypothetical protein
MRGRAAACSELAFPCKMRACRRNGLVSTHAGTVIPVDHAFNVSRVYPARRSACCHMTTRSRLREGVARDPQSQRNGSRSNGASSP